MIISPEHEAESIEWIAGQIRLITDTVNMQTPADWAESSRYLPPSVTPEPGYYSFDVCPPLREIADCMGVNSPVRVLAFMKGAQIGATVGILENTVGYVIGAVSSAPVMMITADAELAKLRLQKYIMPMIEQSGLADRIQANDGKKTRRTGQTSKDLEWRGGGFFLPIGANNEDKMRSTSIQYLLGDEVDSFPGAVGNDGDPCELAATRTNSYTQTRKIAWISTPLLEGSSRISEKFAEGDQRYYNVPCVKCGEMQVLEFYGKNEDGSVYGLIYETTEDGRLVPGSVRYRCRFCGHDHLNADKITMLPKGEWRPTAVPKHPTYRSYHLSALYAPASMFGWEQCVLAYLDAWDVTHNRPKNQGKFQVFRNNILGKTFRPVGGKLTLSQASAHKRDYVFGKVPNKFAAEHSGGPISFLTCTVDVHKTFLAVAVWGWSSGQSCYLIDYWHMQGDCEDLDDPDTWGRLRTLIDEKQYEADERCYRICLTLVDSNYNTDIVNQFCSEYASSVYPVIGKQTVSNRSRFTEFSPFTTKQGTIGYIIAVDLYKDRWSNALRKGWDGEGKQPAGMFNCPLNASGEQLRELTVETRREKVDKKTGQRMGWEWFRPSGSRNELWDLLVYGTASMEMIAASITEELGYEQVIWHEFWDYMESEQVHFTLKSSK